MIVYHTWVTTVVTVAHNTMALTNQYERYYQMIVDMYMPQLHKFARVSPHNEHAAEIHFPAEIQPGASAYFADALFKLDYLYQRPRIDLVLAKQSSEYISSYRLECLEEIVTITFVYKQRDSCGHKFTTIHYSPEHTRSLHEDALGYGEMPKGFTDADKLLAAFD